MQRFQQMIDSQYVALLTRSFVALVLLSACIAKLGSRREFIQIVRNYKLVPRSLSTFTSQLIPAAELILAVCLLSGNLTRWSAFAASGLFLLFGGAVGINLIRGRRDVSCGCFGGRDHQLTWALVFRNAVLAALAAAIWFNPNSINDPKPISLEGFASVLAGAALVASWWLWGVISTIWRPNLPNGGQ
jgi:uncharacterized membrane protein YphA (DoxX/SURF4 family)